MTCDCRCHTAPDCDAPFATVIVDVRNVVEAAAACDSCRNAHSPALLNQQLPSESPIPRRGLLVISPEGKTMSWDEYERDMQKRVESWRDQADGENKA